MKELSLIERKQVLLGIMDYVDEFCKTHNICYYLTGGTLLGAVRHKGFIPWDDDMDILMPRKDYERFLKIFNKECFRQFKFLSIENCKGYYLPFGKVTDTRTSLVEDMVGPIDFGVNIDIFPLDNLGDDLEKAKRLNKKINVFRKILLFTKLKYGIGRSLFKKILGNIALVFFHLLPRKPIIKKIISMSKKYELNEKSKYAAVAVTMTYGEREIMEREWFDNSIKVEFENREYNAPANYHEILTHFYKDYMQLPPVEKRVTHHHNLAWWKN